MLSSLWLSSIDTTSFNSVRGPAILSGNVKMAQNQLIGYLFVPFDVSENISGNFQKYLNYNNMMLKWILLWPTDLPRLGHSLVLFHKPVANKESFLLNKSGNIPWIKNKSIS